MNKEEQIIAEFRNLLNKISLLNKGKMEGKLKGYKPSEVHFIEYIGNNEDCNVTKLAEAFFMTNGAISKLYKKLVSKGIIESYQKSNNKKEIYFRLTAKGNTIYKTHEELHAEFFARDRVVFEQTPDKELDCALSFAVAYNKHLDALISEKTKLGGTK